MRATRRPSRALLADPTWLTNKLTRLGIQPLLADYAARAHRDAALDLIRAALTLAIPALASNPRELAPQLLARLAAGDAPGLDEFLLRTRRSCCRRHLSLAARRFTPPGAEVLRFEGHALAVSSVDGAGRWPARALGLRDRTIRLWDLETGAELRRFQGHEDLVTSVAVLPDGRRALSGSDDGTLRLWDLETGAELRRFEGHGVRHLRGGAAPMDGVGSRGHGLNAAAVGSRDRRRTAPVHGAMKESHSVTVLADGRRALSGSWIRTLRLWDLETGAELRRFEGHGCRHQRGGAGRWTARALGSRGPDAAAVGPRDRGRTAPVRGARGCRHAAWRRCPMDGARSREPTTDAAAVGSRIPAPSCAASRATKVPVTSVAVLPDGRRALSGAGDRTLRLWDLETGRRTRRFPGHELVVTSVTVLPDGRRALSEIRRRDVAALGSRDGAELRRFAGHEERA